MKYIDDLKKELTKMKISEAEIEEIIQDYQELISFAIAEGVEEEDLVKKFGEPEHVAKELSENTQKKTSAPQDDDGFSLYVVFEMDDQPQKVNINLVSEDVKIETHDKSEIQILYQGKFNEKDYEASYQSGQMSFKSIKRSGLFGLLNHKEVPALKILLPKQVDFDSLSFTNVNGDIQVDDLKVDKMVIKSTNGDAKIQKIHAKELNWNTVNGDGDYLDIESQTFHSTLVSGDLKLTNAQVYEKLSINTVSGDAEFTQVECQEFDFHSVSGDVDANNFYPKEIYFSSVSGDAKITNEKKSNIEIKRSKSVSGEIQIKTK